MNNIQVQNTNKTNMLDCSTYGRLSVNDYLKETNTYGIIMICIGATALVISTLLFIDTLRYIILNIHPKYKVSTSFVMAVYPITCFGSFITILVPESYLIAEALNQVIFMTGMYRLFCLFISYCDGESQLIKTVEATPLSLKVSPCCCWPCCSVLPTVKVNTNSIRYLRLLVLQLPVIQCILYFIFLVLWAESSNLYQFNYIYFQPIVIASILFGVWGMVMTVELLKCALAPDFLHTQKFLVLQMILVLSKLQGFTTKILVWTDRLPCIPPMNPQAHANLIHNTLMAVEIVPLTFLARRFYKRCLLDCDSNNTNTDTNCNNNHRICTTSERITPISTSNNNNDDGIDNLGFR